MTPPRTSLVRNLQALPISVNLQRKAKLKASHKRRILGNSTDRIGAATTEATLAAAAIRQITPALIKAMERDRISVGSRATPTGLLEAVVEVRPISRVDRVVPRPCSADLKSSLLGMSFRILHTIWKSRGLFDDSCANPITT